MSTITKITLADLAERFGPMPLERICLDPWPGTATEQELMELSARDEKLYELVDGVLVEKPMGLPEAFLAGVIMRLLCAWVVPRKLGFVFPGDGLMRLAPGVVGYPDVSFVKINRFPEGKVQRIPVPDLVPDLAVEVLSPSNTDREMESKRHDYFSSGTQLVWQVDPETRTVEVFTAPDHAIVLTEAQTLDGGNVLPGFQLPIRDIFADMESA